MAGPKRPQDRMAPRIASIGLRARWKRYKQAGPRGQAVAGRRRGLHDRPRRRRDRGDHELHQHLEPERDDRRRPAGAQRREKGLKVKPWVKTSLAPGQPGRDRLSGKAGPADDLDKLGFNLVGFGCTTCIGNSGPLPKRRSRKAINDNGLSRSVLSGNRNFEGRVSPDVQANYLASPPLVVAYALAGTVNIDLTTEPLGKDKDGKPVYLKDIWPSNQEIQFVAKRHRDVQVALCRRVQGRRELAGSKTDPGLTYAWDDGSTYVQNPPYFDGMQELPPAVNGHRRRPRARPVRRQDHHRPHLAGRFDQEGKRRPYLPDERQVRPQDFNQYGTRRGNHEVMMRGTFANIRIKNHMVKEPNGNASKAATRSTTRPASRCRSTMRRCAKQEGVPLVSSPASNTATARRATGRQRAPTCLACGGDRAVVRAHPPLEPGRHGRHPVLRGLADVEPRKMMTAEITFFDGEVKEVPILCRIDTLDELDYVRNGGILHTVLRNLAKASA
jgi:aconitate hydratase